MTGYIKMSFNRQIIVIAHDIRSCHNIGSLFRTAEGLGIKKIYLTGYTPYPISSEDQRLPYIAQKIDRQIEKTALGASKNLPWNHDSDIVHTLTFLHNEGFRLIALEQNENSHPLPSFIPSTKTALIVGNEVDGLPDEVLKICDAIIEIPMFGKKESFNVVQAAAMAMYQIRFS